MVDVYFFEKPTIAYCKTCDEAITYKGRDGLRCTKCQTNKLSIFEWDGDSEYPE